MLFLVLLHVSRLKSDQNEFLEVLLEIYQNLALVVLFQFSAKFV